VVRSHGGVSDPVNRPDEHPDVCFLKATLAWVVGPHGGLFPDPPWQWVSPGDQFD